MLANSIAGTLATLRAAAMPYSWPLLVWFSRQAVLDVLQRIDKGQPLATDEKGAVTWCGGAGEAKRAVLRAELGVAREAFLVRALLFTDMVRRLFFRI
jgi:hypothetical protein